MEEAIISIGYLGSLIRSYLDHSAISRRIRIRYHSEEEPLGTAGAIDTLLSADVYEIDAAIQHDVTDIDGIAGQHVSLPPRVELGREGVTIATGDHFVDDVEAVAVIRPLGAGLVDMEAYGDRAKEMLRTTDYSVVEIARRVGYDNANYFSAVFHRMTGLAPSPSRRAAFRYN